jgi:tRNA pseudouridine(55) synthase
MHGILIVDKPRGPTSADVVAEVKRRLRAEKVGHTGTLDPMATGVLPIAVGEGTKLAPFLLADDKAYEGELAIDLETCEHCGGRTKVIALVRDPDGIARYLRHLSEPIEPPPLSPARAPPYDRSRVLRRRPADQGELFDG